MSNQPTTLRPPPEDPGGINTRLIVIGGIVVLVIGGVALSQFSLPKTEDAPSAHDVVLPAADPEIARSLPADYSHLSTPEPEPQLHAMLAPEPPPPPPMPPQDTCVRQPIVYSADQLAAAPAHLAAYNDCLARQDYERRLYAYSVEYGSRGQGQGGGQVVMVQSRQPTAAAGGMGSTATPSSGGTAGVQPVSSPGGGSEPRDRHEDFRQRSSANRSLYHEASPEDLPVDECVIPAGSYIPAATMQDVNMGLPGEASVQVTRDVRDITGEHVAIPAGSRITVAYDHQISRGQKRAQAMAAILTLPDYRTVSLNGLSSYDATGQAGIGIDVNNHFMRRLGVAVLGSMIDAIPALAGQRVGIEISSGVSQVTSIGGQLVEEEFSIPPEVKPTPAGTEILIGVSQHIVMGECYGE